MSENTKHSEELKNKLEKDTEEVTSMEALCKKHPEYLECREYDV